MAPLAMPRTGSRVVFFYLKIEVLAGEHEIIYERHVIVDHFSEWLISIVTNDAAAIVNHQPDRAYPILQIEVLIVRDIPVPPGAGMLGKYLGIGVDICFCQRAVG